jgi:hypothetical protein
LLYLDNIDFGSLNVPLSWVPRIRVYDKHTIQEFIAMDEQPRQIGGFGKREVIHPIKIMKVPAKN